MNRGLFWIIACFILVVIMGFSPVSSVRHLEVYRPGDTIEFHVNILNDAGRHHSTDVHEKCHGIEDEKAHDKCVKKYSSLDDVRVRAYFIDTGDVGYGSDTIKIVAGDKVGKWVFFNIPMDMKKGDYLIRVVTSDGGQKDVKYTYVTIV